MISLLANAAMLSETVKEQCQCLDTAFPVAAAHLLGWDEGALMCLRAILIRRNKEWRNA